MGQKNKVKYLFMGLKLLSMLCRNMKNVKFALSVQDLQNPQH